MSIGQGPQTRTLYFGPATGLYEPIRFDTFAKLTIVKELQRLGSPSACNPEGDVNTYITYHYSGAGVGIIYIKMNSQRCSVNLVGGASRSKGLEGLTAFVFTEDNKHAHKR